MAWPLRHFAAAPLLPTLALHVDNLAALEQIVLTSFEELDLLRQLHDYLRLGSLQGLPLPGAAAFAMPRLSTYDQYAPSHKRHVGGPSTPPIDRFYFNLSLQDLELQLDAIFVLLSHLALDSIDLWHHSPAGRLRYYVMTARARRATERHSASTARCMATLPAGAVFTRTPEDKLPRAHTVSGLSITHAARGAYRSGLDELFSPELDP